VLGSVLAVIVCLILLAVGFILIAVDSPKATHNGTWIDIPEAYIGECGNFTGCDACSYKTNCGFCYDGNNKDSTGVCMLADSNQPLQSSNGSRCSDYQDSNDRMINGTSMVFANGWCPSKFAFLPILDMVIYLCAFSSGFGPMPWTINAEIYPHFARSTGNACATATNWAFNLIIAETFLTLANAISRQGAFFLYAGITAIGWVVFYFIVPETKDKTLEELEGLFNKPWFGKRTDAVAQSRRSSAPIIDYIGKSGTDGSLSATFDPPKAYQHRPEDYNSIPSSQDSFEPRSKSNV